MDCMCKAGIIPNAGLNRPLRVDQAASVLSVPLQQIYDWLRDGTLKHYEIRSPSNPAKIHTRIYTASVIELLTASRKQIQQE